MAARPAVFLDRDGVLNAAIVRDGRPYPPASADEMELLPGVVESCRELREAGLALLVVTNQPDIARGLTRRSAVDAINARLCVELPIDDVWMCPHDVADDCRCRKPRPGMILDAARAWGVDLEISTLVGDRWRDIDAGQAAGVTTVFVDHGYSEPCPTSADLVVSRLADAVPFILERAGRQRTRI